MRRLVMTTALALCLGATGAVANTASVDQVSPDGDIIWLDDGTSYEVTSGDVSGWSEGDSIWTDGSIMVDTDQDDQVSVSPR